MLSVPYNVPDIVAKVTIVVPVWNSGKWLPGCLEALQKQTFQDFSVLLVDNGSEDGSVEQVKQCGYTNVYIITFAKNLGFAAAVNAGIRQNQSPYIALLNVDTLPAVDWLEQLVNVMDSAPADVTSLASKMLMMDAPARIDSAGDMLSWFGSALKRGHDMSEARYRQQEKVFSACAGACLYRRSFFEKAGYFDERFTSYFEDIDIGFREKLMGFSCLYVPGAEVLHQGHGSGVAGNYYVFLLTRNRLLTILKNTPLKLMLRHWHQLIYGQFYFFLVYKRPVASIKGYLSALFLLPGILRSRKEIQIKRKISLEALDSMLSADLGQPALWEIILQKFT